jgi:hypothetical protein
MGGAENRVAKNVKEKIKQSETFDLTVTATWDTLKDSEIMNDMGGLSKIVKEKKETSEIENPNKFVKDAQKALYEKIKSTKDPKRILRINYEGHLNNSKKEALTTQNIGCDIWMSNYFVFDDKDKCKYKSA